jgi:tetratricopeptide (TPR) repeat protein
MARSYDQALVLYRRALRYALANEGPEALRTAQAHNNIAYALARLGRYHEALPEQQVATELYVRIYGAAHPLSAARLMNLGALHYYLQRIDSAQHYFDRAEQVYTAIEASPEHEQNVYKLHAQLLNNQAALDVAKKNYEAAYERLNKALAILPQEEEDDLLLLYRSMTAVCHFAGRTDDEQHFAQLAQTLAAKLGRN